MEGRDGLDEFPSVVGKYLVYHPKNQFDSEVFEKTKQFDNL